jgi:hypothetical protein
VRYFVDHNTRTTTFDDPRPGSAAAAAALGGGVNGGGPKGAYGVPAQYERSFRWKLNQFRYLCQSNALPSHIKLSVSRATLFEDSFHQIMRLPAYELRRRLYIIFKVPPVFTAYTRRYRRNGGSNDFVHRVNSRVSTKVSFFYLRGNRNSDKFF